MFMITPPALEYRPEQPFAAIRTQVAIPFGQVLGPLWGEVAAWLESQGIAPSGAPFIRYLTTDMSAKLDIEVGFPVAAASTGNGRVVVGAFPAGRYAVLVYTGPYEGDGLVKATAALLDWAKANHVTWRVSHNDGVEWWDGRAEWYLTDPRGEPDPQKWQTELAFLTAGK
jgi:effector-binding domain-containing protein